MKQFIIRALAPLFISAAVTTLGSVNPNTVVAHFGDKPIYAEEFTLHIRDQVALVAVHFKTRHQVDLSGDNWLQRYKSEIPVELLLRRSLESCRRSKAIQLLALKHELAEKLPFPGFQEMCWTLNRTRANAKAEGRILFGPLEYSPAQLYKYKLTNMQNHLKNMLSDGDERRREALLERKIREQKDDMPVALVDKVLNQLIAEQVGASTSLRADLGGPDLPGRAVGAE